jgi:nicotinamidase-related amidase
MKKTLIVIDCQNDFIDGVLGTKEAQAIIPNVKKKIEEYKSRGDKVIFTRDTHHENYLKTNEGKRLPIPHCIKDTYGWQISSELDTDVCEIIDKNTFGYTQWYMYGIGHYIEEIEVVGLDSDICVLSNALILKATFPEADIIVDASCCAGVTPESHKNALEAMKMCQIDIIGE